MPNLPLHIAVAGRAARGLSDPSLDGHMGPMYLGSTAPDIRAVTRRRREDYHFSDLGFHAVGAGVGGLFAAHPNLARGAGQSPETQAFVAGYISHLVADETWIVEVYRPYFGNRDVFPDPVAGRLMDRALQLDLDRQAVDVARVALPLIQEAGAGVDVGFIPPADLAKWRDWVVQAVSRDFSWERLRHMVRRIGAGDDGDRAQAMVDDFLTGMPRSLECLYARVPAASVDAFVEQAVRNGAQAMREYLA